MLKKVIAVCLSACLSFGIVASAEKNPYNEMDFINTSGGNLEDYAKMKDIDVEEFKKEYGLPEDMPNDTNFAAVLEMMTLENFAKVMEIDAKGLIEDMDNYFKLKIDKNMQWNEIESSLPAIAYIAFFDGHEYNDFTMMYDLPDDFEETTPFGEIRTQIDRIRLEYLNALDYYTRNSLLVMLKGRYLDFDVEPKIINDRTMLPLRSIFEGLGAMVQWDGETKTIIAVKDTTTVVMQVGQEAMFVNGEKVEIDSPSVIVEDRTLVPVRAIANAFGNEVFYNENTRTVVIH